MEEKDNAFIKYLLRFRSASEPDGELYFGKLFHHFFFYLKELACLANLYGLQDRQPLLNKKK